MNRLLRTLVVFFSASLPFAQNATPLSKRFPGTPIQAPDGGCFHPGIRSHVGTRTMCSTGVVTPPTGWFSGDTHEHAQLCFSPTLKT